MPTTRTVDADRDPLERMLDLARRRATGRLEYEVATRPRRVYFREGRIQLPAQHAFAADVRGLLESNRDRARRESWEPLLIRLGATWASQGPARGFRFHPGLGELPVDLLGPIPTLCALLHAHGAEARDGRSRFVEAIESGARLSRSPDGPERPDGLAWLPEESWVIERIGPGASFEGLASESPIPRERLLVVAASLVGVGVLSAEGLVGRGSTARSPGASDPVRLAEIFARRIGESLAERPLELGDEELRTRVGRRLAASGGQTYYELLGIEPGADESATRDAFEEVAREVHPLHARRLGLERDAFRDLFERVVDAYHVLSDPSRRVAYNARVGVVPTVASDSAEGREEESRALARELFDRARFEILNGDYQSALTLLERTLELDDRAEYQAELGKLLSRNPAWTDRALGAFSRALELDPAAGEYRFALGQLYERKGDLERAKLAFDGAVRSDPPVAKASDALARVRAALGEPVDSGGSGALGRLFRRS